VCVANSEESLRSQLALLGTVVCVGNRSPTGECVCMCVYV